MGFVAWVQQLSREQQLTILRLSVSPGPNVVDRAVMVAAIEQSGLALAFASDELRADHDVVRGALEMDGYALQYVSDELKSDQNFVMVAVTENGLALEFASDGLKEQVDVVLAAVKQDGLALEFAGGGGDFGLDLKDDIVVVLAAVRQDYAAAEFVSDEMRNSLTSGLGGHHYHGFDLPMELAQLGGGHALETLNPTITGGPGAGGGLEEFVHSLGDLVHTQASEINALKAQLTALTKLERHHFSRCRHCVARWCFRVR